MEDHGVWFSSRLSRSKRRFLSSISRLQLRADVYEALTGRYSGGPDCLPLEENVSLSAQDIRRLNSTKSSELESTYQAIQDHNHYMSELIQYDDL